MSSPTINLRFWFQKKSLKSLHLQLKFSIWVMAPALPHHKSHNEDPHGEAAEEMTPRGWSCCETAVGGRDTEGTRSRMLLTRFPIYIGSDDPPRAKQQSGCLFMLNLGEKEARKFHFLKEELIKWEDYYLSSSETALGD